MTFEEYQREAVKFRTPESDNEEYLRLGLISEIGEVAGKLAKGIRDGNFDEKAFVKELGDVLWFVANLAQKKGITIRPCGPFMSMAESSFVVLMTCTAGDSIEIEHANGLGYILRYVKHLALIYGYTLEDVMEINLAKLRDRQYRGVICGNGDER